METRTAEMLAKGRRKDPQSKLRERRDEKALDPALSTLTVWLREKLGWTGAVGPELQEAG